MAKKILFLFLCFTSFFNFAQDRRTIINGKVTDSLKLVKNANIINLTTNQGTFSADDGTFRLFVKQGDSVRVSSIQHITKIITITEQIINTKKMAVKLAYNTVVLDTFELKRHNLLGSLEADSKSVPVDKKEKALKSILDFSDIDMSIEAPDDLIDKMKPNLVTTDPTERFAGAGAGFSMPFKDSERLWALRKKLARQKAFPYKILSELGDKFFFDELKIPVDRYFHFLEYCNPLGIEDLHKEKKILELIKILQSESKSYLLIIKKE
ncbi:hypothetical protein BXQ17_02510 [Polaribacter sp. BM10]|uniref:hypothetical protein n=1 Tax=Polaribacter sp. BM10 TaxID=1529069 RepID=UPI00098A730E|nr:hypothetical protein [Polaribacter sp. BM10]AQS93011.1 hypothetical protein BXQ17_02510 [Polaribacter sp. BM10]